MNDLVELIKKSSYVICLTGAGISTLSGIKDFRGENGLGKVMNPEKIFDINTFHRDPSFFYKYAKEIVFDLHNIEPSEVHLLLAKMEQRGFLKALITQNIDQLHQKAGSKKVLEIHGSAQSNRCLSCGKRYSYDEIIPFVLKGVVPSCTDCSGIIKPNIVFYGEQLPEVPFERSREEAKKSDLILALGSSLLVHPAASFIDMVLASGGKLAIVNNQKTPYDSYASFKMEDLREFASVLNEGLFS